MAIGLRDLPKFLVLEPGGGIRLDVHLDSSACEFEMALENERPGRSFIVMLGHRAGTIVQRVRLAGRAKILFDPESPGDYTLVLTNPMAEPAVVRLNARPVGRRARIRPSMRRTSYASKSKARRKPKRREGAD
ncbi:MAG: hypothetical protein L3K05_05760 [Thermoplasmata archaeon]|nr:hypothetical protein [Thermoplasmata archaeon]